MGCALMKYNKKYEAIITGRLYKHFEHLQTEIEIDDFLHMSGCPLYEYYGSTKMFLHSVLKEAKIDADTLFMVKISGMITEVDGREKLEYKLEEVCTMDWKYEN